MCGVSTYSVVVPHSLSEYIIITRRDVAMMTPPRGGPGEPGVRGGKGRGGVGKGRKRGKGQREVETRRD